MERLVKFTCMGDVSPDTRTFSVSRLMFIAMALAAFGPYLVGGVRTEQAIVYLAAVLVLVLRGAFLQIEGGLKFLIPWTLMFVIALLGVFFPLDRTSPWESGGFLAGVDNLLLPIAVTVTIWSIVRPDHAEELLHTVAKIVVWAMSINAVLAVIDTRVDLSGFLRGFWSSEDLGSTTAERAAAAGRVSGIFNQPAEAGIAYGIAGLLAVYLYSRNPKRLALSLLLISIGGLLTVSKIFVLGAVPLIVTYLLLSRSFGKRLGLIFSGVLVAGAVTQSGLLEDWEGSAVLTRLFNPPATANLIEFYSANRWVAGSDLLDVIGTVIALSPVVGVGAGGWEVAYDSSWTQGVVVAGIIGAICVLLVYIGFFLLAKGTREPRRKMLTFFMAVLLFGASFGIPALTANRVATLVWIIVALLVVANRAERGDLRQTSPRLKERSPTGTSPSGGGTISNQGAGHFSRLPQ